MGKAPGTGKNQTCTIPPGAVQSDTAALAVNRQPLAWDRSFSHPNGGTCCSVLDESGFGYGCGLGYMRRVGWECGRTEMRY